MAAKSPGPRPVARPLSRARPYRAGPGASWLLSVWLLGLLWLLPAGAQAGAWSPAPGHGYAKLWLKWLYGFGFHAGDGKTYDYGRYNEVFLNAYGEVGLVPKLAATLHFPFAELFALEDPRTGDAEHHFTAGDPALGLRYQVLSLGRWAMALETFVRVPLAPAGVKQDVFERDTGRKLGGLRIGTGVFDVYGGGAVGYGGDRFYGAGSAGFMARTGGYDGVVTWTGEVGGQYSERFRGRLRMTGVHPVNTGSAPRHESPSGIGNGTRYLGFSLETEYLFSPRWVAGLGLQGGGGLLARQSGGPVTDFYVATAW